MLTLLTTYPLNTHFMWLRLSTDKSNKNPGIQLTDYLELKFTTCCLSGIVMRKHDTPGRIDVLCYRAEGDCLLATWKAELPEHTRAHVNVKVWSPPSLIKPTIVLTDDSHGLSAISWLCQWRDQLPSHLLLWQTQGMLPFPLAPSTMYTRELPADMIATMRECEAFGLVLRVLSDIEKPGCFHGDIAALLKQRVDLSDWQVLRMS